jgi:integrase
MPTHGLPKSARMPGTALVFGDVNGKLRNPEHVSAEFRDAIGRCRKAVGEDALPVIRLHGLRHTHATILLRAGRPVREVSERLGHANPAITLRVYAHVLPGDQRAAAATLARLVEEAKR